MNVKTIRTVDVATGGNPQRAVAAAVREIGVDAGAVYHLSVAHEPGCPCTQRRPLRSCSCEIVRLVLKQRVR